MSGVILRAAGRYLDRISPRIAAHADLGSALVDFVEYTIEAARREEIIGLLFGSDEELAGVGLAAGTSTSLFEIVTEFLRPIFTRHWSCVEPGVSVDDAAEWVVRTILSLLTVRGPRERSRDGLRAFLSRFLLPAILASDHRRPV
ncbi:TetR family transcriptional regulator [Mycolicibacterium cosmeticum]|uniref:TetR family transcriptional regulator n=4 Tax=Mycobacteriaceae TaxID=1762 RepID=W9AT51_MYCCO|nr:TetR family transcriptional regulator [Mycolicibacterium cosmeticum]